MNTFNQLVDLTIDGCSKKRLIYYYSQYIDIFKLKKYILVNNYNPVYFIAALLASVFCKKIIILSNPAWRLKEWSQVVLQIEPDFVIGVKVMYAINWNFKGPLKLNKWYLLISTGGTLRGVRFVWHSWKNLLNSVDSLMLNQKVAINHYCCILPFCHISGLMQLVRSLKTFGVLTSVSRSHIKQCSFPNVSTCATFVSLVPSQLEKMINSNVRLRWLSYFSHVFLGGDVINNNLLEYANMNGFSVITSYGLTETSAMVIAKSKKYNFHNNDSVGSSLFGVQTRITSRSDLIQVRSNSLLLGYYPTAPKLCKFLTTSDMGVVNDQGCLFDVSRVDRVVISGGQKVDPIEVRCVLIGLNLIDEIIVIPVFDLQWGYRLSVLYKYFKESINLLYIRERFNMILSDYKFPRQWIQVKEFPLNGSKISRKRIGELMSLDEPALVSVDSFH